MFQSKSTPHNLSQPLTGAQNSPFAGPRSNASSRVALMGAVGLAVTAGVLANSLTFAVPSAFAQTASIQAPSFADVVENVRGAVVSVKVNTVEKVDASNESGIPDFAPGDPLERFFRRFGDESGPGQRNGRSPRAQGHKGQSQGSGFIISADGYVVTNNHVVENATDISITLDNGKSIPVTLIGTDKKTDLALLKINEKGNWAHVSFAEHSPRVGEWVIAVGNPFGLGGTVTAGIVSARGRDIGAGPYDDFLQIDAPVNRGNSGGPTFDAKGTVVGVNTAIYSPSGGSVGIGFAIPAEVARDVVAALKEKGSVTRGWIGVQIQPVTPDIADSLGLASAKGALVAEPQVGSPAASAGLKSGDVITKVDGEIIEGPKELARKIASLGPDRKIDLTFLRGGLEKNVAVRLGTLPSEKQAAAEKPAMQEKNVFASLGLALAPASSVRGSGGEGVVIAGVDPDGIAAQKGLRMGDVIVEASGRAVSNPSDISAALTDARKEGRKSVLLRVRTGEATRFVAIAPNPAS